MVKVKQKKQNPSLENEGCDLHETDPHGDSSWVIVKKQMITILLPPLPIVEEPAALKPRPKPVNGSPRTTSGEKCHQPEDLVPEGGISTGGFVASPLNLTAPQRPDSQPPCQLGAVELCKSQKTSRSLKRIWHKRRFSYPCSYPDGCALIQHRLRAQNLERKLESAGGLSRWLVSLGLGQFVRIFEHRSVSKFQLASLTMNKLKHMGAVAVGPRRKLMHALDCCCGL
ncbi:hypothetical protein SAY87_026696 [Trapa incisa]|uniref:SAM domain-containing protein n=1 Tax=Trapa incisa TaxID=236973 RepID=A0AAN7H447_9MYRT|nr:hypothetical protein SAY87_026696 [Trapa incisa]